MTLEEAQFKLKLLNYVCYELDNRTLGSRLFFVHKDYSKEFESAPPHGMKRSYLASYIFSLEDSEWTKIRQPIPPLTETEQLLYAKT